LISLNRTISWIFSVVAVLSLSIGYIMARLNIDRAIIQPVHIYLGYGYFALLLAHFLLSLTVIGFNWKSIFADPYSLFNEWTATRGLQRVSGWILLFGSALMILTGLGFDDGILWKIISFTLHVQIDQFVALGLIIHLAVGVKSALARRRIRLPNRALTLLTIALVMGVTLVDFGLVTGNTIALGPSDIVFPEDYTDPVNTMPRRVDQIRLGRVLSGISTVYTFDPDDVNTTRPDIFNPGYFSVFDILVHVAERDDIELEYHFDEALNTFVIDKLMGGREWWYEVYYDGGWPESNFYRMDHYPWKDGASLTFYETTPEQVDKRHLVFRDEVRRLEENGGKVIIQNVYISGILDLWEYDDVEVTAHNVRPDMFKPGVITAIDVILSLADTRGLNYTVQWYESIGDARLVKNYWVESINGDSASGRCGFVHEEGSVSNMNRGGNHIHLPSDIKVLTCPEYAWWFYICV
jgi:hypothetical protein